PFVLDGGKMGETVIASKGISHHIRFAVDHIRQEPKITLDRSDSIVKTGTRVAVGWPISASSKLANAKARFFPETTRATLDVMRKGRPLSRRAAFVRRLAILRGVRRVAAGGSSHLALSRRESCRPPKTT